jgi:hypothetical protein
LTGKRCSTCSGYARRRFTSTSDSPKHDTPGMGRWARLEANRPNPCLVVPAWLTTPSSPANSYTPFGSSRSIRTTVPSSSPQSNGS